MTYHDLAKIVGDWLLAWQTLIAGMLALFGAWLTVRALRVQNQNESERKLRGARAMLPATIDGIQDYAIESVRWLEGVREKGRLSETGTYRDPIPVNTSPRLSPDIVLALRDCVETFKIEEARYVSALLSKIQVQRARISELEDYFTHFSTNRIRASISANINDFIADSVEIAAFSAQLYPFARYETDGPVVAPDLAAVTSAFHSCHLQEIQNVDPWNALSNRYLPKRNLTLGSA